MPEGEGYQPSAAELGPEAKLGLEYLESAGIIEQPVFAVVKNKDNEEQEVQIGIQHVDSAGNILDRTETWNKPSGPEKQTIQYTYLEDRVGAIENSKITEGEKAGWEFRREHPMTSHEVEVRWADEDIAESVIEKVTAVLVNLGQTTAGTDNREPFAHFEIKDDPATLQIFSGFRREPGDMHPSQKGNMGGVFNLDVNGRQVLIERIDKVSVDFGADGLPIKVVLHSYHWSEGSAAGK